MKDLEGSLSFGEILDIQIAVAAAIVRALCSPEATANVASAAESLANSLRGENRQIGAFMDDFAVFLRRTPL